MARLVLDTNVLVSALISDGKPRRLLRRCVLGQDTLLASSQTLAELADVLRRPKFRMEAEEVQRAVRAVALTALLIQPRSRFHVVAVDPDDDRFLELAVDGAADILVSGDKHLLALKTFQGIPVRSVVDALGELEAS